MKKIAVLIIFCFGIVLVCQAQKPYSVENLEILSQEELDVYYNKALKKQKTGKTLAIVGATTFGASVLGIIGASNIEGEGMEALFFFPPALIGLSTMAVGLPMKITGKKRVERINTIRSTALNDINFQLQPCAQFNYSTQKYQPGITLKINF